MFGYESDETIDEERLYLFLRWHAVDDDEYFYWSEEYRKLRYGD